MSVARASLGWWWWRQGARRQLALVTMCARADGDSQHRLWCAPVCERASTAVAPGSGPGWRRVVVAVSGCLGFVRHVMTAATVVLGMTMVLGLDDGAGGFLDESLSDGDARGCRFSVGLGASHSPTISFLGENPVHLGHMMVPSPTSLPS